MSDDETTRLLTERTLVLNTHEFGTVLGALYTYICFQNGDADNVDLDALNELITVRDSMPGLKPDEVLALMVSLVNGNRVPEIDESFNSGVYVPEFEIVKGMVGL